jgi:hypothetical protein
MWTRWATTARLPNIQQLLLSNGFSNKHVSMETIEQNQRNRVFYEVHAEDL